LEYIYDLSKIPDSLIATSPQISGRYVIRVGLALMPVHFDTRSQKISFHLIYQQKETN
jgi:hypothetical protein